MTKTLSWRSVPAQAEMRRLCFAAEVYRMYVKYAESRRWRTEMMSLNENGTRRFQGSHVSLITGQGAYSRLKYESGVHRVQRVPETESRRKNPYFHRDRSCPAGSGGD